MTEDKLTSAAEQAVKTLPPSAGEAILHVAIAEIGTTEDPPDSNHNKYGKWYGFDGVAWCAEFVSWCYDQAGYPLPAIQHKHGFCGCQNAYNYFKKNNNIVAKELAKPGFIVLYDWDKDGRCDHVGIFEKDNGDGTFSAIEGNTAVGNDSNGGKVMRRSNRKYSQAIIVHPQVLDQIPVK